MTLATSDQNGYVTARVVLLKGFGEEGFTFYTNYASTKARQLAENPRAALVFHWPHLQRQVRIEGTVQKISHEESETYFRSRPRPSQLSAAVSPQSEVIPSRAFLEEQVRLLQDTLGDQPVPLPDNWGGYRLTPEVIEFWQHRDNRLHDRIRYRKDDAGQWRMERLAP
jgi:pyridoxamine 5'-phosphate oxidase